MFWEFVFSWFGLLAFSPVVFVFFVKMYKTRKAWFGLFWTTWHNTFCKGETVVEYEEVHSGELWGETVRRYNCTKCAYEECLRHSPERMLKGKELDAEIEGFGKFLEKQEEKVEEKEKSNKESKNRFNMLEM